jgi:hypothetical protein
LRPEVVPRAWVAEARPLGEVAVVAPRRASAAAGARAALRRAVVERVAPSAAAARLVPKVQRALAVARWAPPKPTDVARPVASLAAHGQLLGRS